MKLEKAYSLQVERKITAQEADQLFQSGKIDSKFLFECPDKICNAQVTCANLDKAIIKRKRDPYYTTVSDHITDCAIQQDIQKGKRRGSLIDDNFYSEEDKYFDKAIRLNLQPPSSRRPEGNSEKITEDNEDAIVRGGQVAEEGKRKVQKTKTLSSMIDAYIKDEKFDVQLPSIGLIELSELFVEIDGQNINDFPDELRVYYGKAWINQKESGFVVNFKNMLKCETMAEAKRPSFFIGFDKVEVSNFRKFQRATLVKLANTQPKVVYILSETGPYPSSKGPFINFWLSGLEHMDYRL